MFKRILVLLILMLQFLIAFSHTKADSLSRLLVDATSDTMKVKLMVQIARTYESMDNKQANEWLAKAYDLATSIKYERGLAIIFFEKGTTFNNNSDYSGAIENFNKALLKYKNLHNKLFIARTYQCLGQNNFRLSQFDKTMTYYLEALKIFIELKDIDGISSCYKMIGMVYANQEKYSTGIEFFNKAIQVLGNNSVKSVIKAHIYANIFTSYQKLKNNTKALTYVDSIVPYYIQSRDFRSLMTTYNNIGVTYTTIGNYIKARNYISMAMKYADQFGSPIMQIVTANSMAELYNKINKPDSAIILLKHCLELNKKLNLQERYLYIYGDLFETYEMKGDFKNALMYHKLFKAVNDTLEQELSKQKLYEVQTHYDVDKKNQQIELLNNQNEVKSARLSKQRVIMFFEIVLAFFLLILAIVLYNRYRLKQKTNQILQFKNNEIEQQKEEIMGINEMLEMQKKELLELDKMKTNFFTNISHEFRTPLSLIIGPLTSLIEKTKDAASLHEYQLMLNQARRLLNLINQILDLTKLRNTKMKLSISYSDITKFFDMLLSSFSSLALESNISLTHNFDSEPLHVWFDKDKVEKIVINLVSNALKHTPKNGYIDVRLMNKIEVSGFIEISFKDSGAGIATYDLKNIFEPFYQADNSVNRKIEGTGIGLALVKELAALHGGGVFVKNIQEHGAEFTVNIAVTKEKLPLAEVLQEQPEKIELNNLHELYIQDETTKSPIKNELIKDKVTILIVEDNEQMRQFISNTVLGEYQVLEAVNGADGLAKAIEINPDLIITDIMMPVMDGNAMTNELKNDVRTSHIPIIMLTAKASEESKIEALRSFADDYLTKPFNATELTLRVRNAIAHRQKLREKFQKSISINPSEVTASSLDKQFICKALQIVEAHMSDSEFTAEDFCFEIAMARSQVHRKLKAIVDQPVTEFIRCIRLKRAASLISQNSATISEIAYQTGFTNLSYFSKSFKEYFGVSPSEYI